MNRIDAPRPRRVAGRFLLSPIDGLQGKAYRPESPVTATMELNNSDLASLSALQLTPDQIARRITAPLHHEYKEKSSAGIDLIAGGVAGSAGVIVGHPFDSIKVRMQMASSTAAISAGSQYGGITTLFRGIGAPFFMAAVINSSIFVTYGESGRIWDKYIGSSSSTASKHFICGGFTGMVSSLVICPTEHVKVRLQTQRSGSDIVYRNSFDAAKRIFSSHGVTGLYRGFAATCLRQSPGFAAYFGTYDRLKEQGQHFFGSDHMWLSSIVAGGVAGSLSWAVVYPIDLVKSRIQAVPLSATKNESAIWSIVVNVTKEQGWASLYRGLGITVFRAFPVNGIIFPTYELTSALLNGKM